MFLKQIFILTEKQSFEDSQRGYEPLNLEGRSFVNSDNFDSNDLIF